ncbi:hypothetical protein HWV62_22497 [Athelia sp. TMB]|nr:hypothetical protein HWV62_22497 [Athelia sp. TMB]
MELAWIELADSWTWTIRRGMCQRGAQMMDIRDLRPDIDSRGAGGGMRVVHHSLAVALCSPFIWREHHLSRAGEDDDPRPTSLAPTYDRPRFSTPFSMPAHSMSASGSGWWKCWTWGQARLDDWVEARIEKGAIVSRAARMRRLVLVAGDEALAETGRVLGKAKDGKSSPIA